MVSLHWKCQKNLSSTDHEAQLALIVSRKCKDIRASKAMDSIFGFTCINDLSQRNIQESDVSGWFRGKSFDTFCPIGPVLVPPEDIGDVQSLRIICWVNGRVVQDGNTKDMIFGVRELLAFVSENFTL
ncbi:MAG: fumarylacetoacetate hydrolase family protein [Spirochaetes bacterium]|nr:fumarylacetoacetate hydrolase family protein [Spirochaetota bacterium]